MTTDLWMLVYCCTLALLSPALYLVGRFGAAGGMEWLMGNRDSALEVPEWTDRAVRAHSNLIESLVPFAALVLVAHTAGLANETTALGATVFFWARVLYVPVYTAGLQPWRTLVWFVGLGGQLVILGQLI